MQDSLFGLGSEENFNVASLPSRYFLEPNEYLFKGGFVKARICVASQLFVKDVVDDMDTLGCCNAASCS